MINYKFPYIQDTYICYMFTYAHIDMALQLVIIHNEFLRKRYIP